jgi:hypothetical protein
MNRLAKIIFPKSSRDVRRKKMNTFLLVAGVTLAFCAALAVIIYKVNTKRF